MHQKIWCVTFVVLYIVLCLDHFDSHRFTVCTLGGPARMFGVGLFVVCVGGLCGKLVRAHGGCLGIESR
jgi:hypothetical protein